MTTGHPDSSSLVLVVDDEPGIVEFLRFALEDRGYRVSTARDGVEALRALARETPDYIVTDLMMPRLDGWELCRRLRGDSATRAVPVIGMSAVDPRQAPVDAFLRKPFELDALLDVLEHLLDKREMVQR
jgi:CheY-like chemotaxis protein